MVTHHDAFLQDILEHPEDDTPRLIYADWLQERGDPRGEMIVVQCRLAQLTPADPEYRRLKRRESTLFEEHGSKWREGIEKRVRSCEFERGFINRVRVTFQELTRHSTLLLRTTPLEHVFLTIGCDDVRKLAKSKKLSLVTDLEIHGHQLGNDSARALLESPSLGELRTLLMHHCGLGPRVAQWIVNAPMQELRRLNLGANDLGDEGMNVLSNSAKLEKLEYLGLGGNELYQGSAFSLAASRTLTSLTEINLGANYLNDTGLTALAEAEHLRSLRTLDLRYNEFTVVGAQLLAESAFLTGLDSLDVSNNSIGTRGRQALTARFGSRVKLD